MRGTTYVAWSQARPAGEPDRRPKRGPLGNDGYGANSTAGVDGYCSLMGRGAHPFIDALGCLRSLRARWRLMELAWAQGCKVENAVGRGLAAGYKIHAVVCSLPRASLLAGARCGLGLRDPWAYAATNSVPSRSIACMMIARQRAKAMRALRMLDRLAIANAHSFSLIWPL